jgi:hypothetical protein
MVLGVFGFDELLLSEGFLGDGFVAVPPGVIFDLVGSGVVGDDAVVAVEVGVFDVLFGFLGVEEGFGSSWGEGVESVRVEEGPAALVQ